MTFRLIEADCVEAMADMDEASVDAIVTDPPYGLEFMGKEWDRLAPNARWGEDHEAQTFSKANGIYPKARNVDGPQVRPAKNPRCKACGKTKFSGSPCVCETPDWDTRGAEQGQAMERWHYAWAVQALRVLKPGGHLLAFGGTRTFHRLTCALEDAGFEIRDCLSWLYGSGFPKSLNLDGDWQGWGTALKPAWEPVVLARKPLTGTVAANVLEHGTGAINVDGCRVEFNDEADESESKSKNRHADFGTLHGGNEVYGDFSMLGARDNYDAPGRWPPNVVLDEEAAALLDEQSGERRSAGLYPSDSTTNNGVTYGLPGRQGRLYEDTGGASRFFKVVRPDQVSPASRVFYTAKAGRAERNRGLEHREAQADRGRYGEGIQDNHPHMPEGYRYEATARNTHPTVKPVSLMQWLVRMVTPPGGTVLDPFTGSGSTGIAALREGFDFIGIEREHDYVEIARDRIIGDAPLFNVEAI